MSRVNILNRLKRIFLKNKERKLAVSADIKDDIKKVLSKYSDFLNKKDFERESIIFYLNKIKTCSK